MAYHASLHVKPHSFYPLATPNIIEILYYMQLREAEMVAKLATSLGMTRGELESELQNSVQGINT